MLKYIIIILCFIFAVNHYVAPTEAELQQKDSNLVIEKRLEQVLESK